MSRRGVLRALGAVLTVGVLVAAVLAVEVGIVLSRDYLDGDDAPQVDAVYGDAAADGVLLLVLGDSTAAGVGVDEPADTVAGGVASRLAEDGRRVTVRSVAQSGARSEDLQQQVTDALAVRADGDVGVALVLVGANDATHLSSLSGVSEHVADAVARLRAEGIPAVVGTCPDLSSLPAFPQPLRAITGSRGRAVADAQTEAVTEAGGTAVDLARETGPAFADDPDRYYSVDEFHPGAAGYDLWASVLTPAVREALERRSVTSR